MLDNFLRKDLSLKSKWWHRLFSVSFVIVIIFSFITSVAVYSDSDMFSGGDVQQWKKIEPLSNRITSDVKTIKGMLNAGEKVAENDRTYVLNDRPDAYYNGVLGDVYCTTELSKQFNTIKESRDIDSLYVRGLYGREEVPNETFADYIDSNGINCLTADAYSDSNGGKQTFIEPVSTYQEKWSVFEKSQSLTNLYYIKMFLSLLGFYMVTSLVVLVIYYKVFLYIVFGSKEKGNTS